MAHDLTHITGNIHQQATELQPDNEAQRLKLLQSARELVHALEKPHERIMRMCYVEGPILTATKTLIDLGVFKILAGSPSPVTAAKLAEDTGADRALLERLLKHIATEVFVDEVGPDMYSANDITRSIASPGGQGTIEDTFELMLVGGAFPKFLRENGYANPTDKDRSGWKYGMKTDQHFFEYVNSPGREKRLEALRNHMQFKTVGLKWYEVPGIMDAAFGGPKIEKHDDVLLIDVGGSGGHDLIGFHQAHPDMPGRLILQDLPTTIASLDAAALAAQRIEPTGHDFFTAQPVRGARAYYLKMCLHDWPDAQCAQILARLRPAMTVGRSRILLNEIVVPDEKAGWFETSVDMLMMQVHSAQERREREWRALVGAVEGLRVRKIWDVDGAVEKVIEIEAV